MSEAASSGLVDAEEDLGVPDGGPEAPVHSLLLRQGEAPVVPAHDPLVGDDPESAGRITRVGAVLGESRQGTVGEREEQPAMKCCGYHESSRESGESATVYAAGQKASTSPVGRGVGARRR